MHTDYPSSTANWYVGMQECKRCYNSADVAEVHHPLRCRGSVNDISSKEAVDIDKRLSRNSLERDMLSPRHRGLRYDERGGL